MDDLIQKENLEAKNEEVNNQDVVIEEPTLEANESEELKDDKQSVDYGSHKKLLNQRKADQQRMRELATKLAELETEKEARQTAELKEQNKYKELYEYSQQKLGAMEQEKEAQAKALVDDHKRRELEKELGGLKNSNYFSFANLDNIVVNDDGTIDKNSVTIEANKFRQNYPELIVGQKNVNINNRAPSNDATIVNKVTSPKAMSAEQREALKRQAILNRAKKQ